MARPLAFSSLPPYCPFGELREPLPNLIESIWHKLKGFLMPRRCYDTLNELQAAFALGLKALNAINV